MQSEQPQQLDGAQPAEQLQLLAVAAEEENDQRQAGAGKPPAQQP
jgi:hypothetical protein